jgi:hypothetical protein
MFLLVGSTVESNCFLGLVYKQRLIPSNPSTSNPSLSNPFISAPGQNDYFSFLHLLVLKSGPTI